MYTLRMQLLVSRARFARAISRRRLLHQSTKEEEVVASIEGGSEDTRVATQSRGWEVEDDAFRIAYFIELAKI